MLRQGHVGWYHWWCGNGAPGGFACLSCLVSAGSGCAFAVSCCGWGVHWGLVCRVCLLTITLFSLMRWLCKSPFVFWKSYGVVRRNKPLIDDWLTPALVLATYHPDDQQLGWWPNMWVRLEWSEWQKIWGIFKTISEWMNEELLETTRYLSISLPHPSKSCSIIGTNWCTANRPTIWSDTPWWGIKHDTRRQNSTVGWQSSGCRLSPTCRFLFYVS